MVGEGAGVVAAAVRADGSGGGRVRVAFRSAYVATRAALTSASGTGAGGGAVVIDGGTTGRLFSSGRQAATGMVGGRIDLLGREVVLVGAAVDASGAAGGGRVRIAAQLIDAANGAHLWADRFDGPLEDVFDLQDQVATSVAGVIEPTLLAAEIRRSNQRPTHDLSAYDFYLRALPFVATYQWTPLIEALDLLRQAIERDPDFASALALAAYCHASLDGIGGVPDRDANRQEALGLAHRALRAAGDDALALAATAHVLGYFNEDIHAAIAIIDRSLALNPSLAYGWRWSGFARLSEPTSRRKRT